jgi:hypothetical protein
VIRPDLHLAQDFVDAGRRGAILVHEGILLLVPQCGDNSILHMREVRGSDGIHHDRQFVARPEHLHSCEDVECDPEGPDVGGEAVVGDLLYSLSRIANGFCDF